MKRKFHRSVWASTKKSGFLSKGLVNRPVFCNEYDSLQMLMQLSRQSASLAKERQLFFENFTISLSSNVRRSDLTYAAGETPDLKTLQALAGYSAIQMTMDHDVHVQP